MTTVLTSRCINITECKPVWLSETSQGFHVQGHIAHHGMFPVNFAFATDEVGTPLLRSWYPENSSPDDRAAILEAVEKAMCDGINDQDDFDADAMFPVPPATTRRSTDARIAHRTNKRGW